MTEIKKEEIIKWFRPSLSEEDKERYAEELYTWLNSEDNRILNDERRQWIKENIWIIALFELGLHANHHIVMQIRRLSMELPA